MNVVPPTRRVRNCGFSHVCLCCVVCLFVCFSCFSSSQGVVEKWDDMERYLTFVIENGLNIANSSEHAFVVSEPPINPKVCVVYHLSVCSVEGGAVCVCVFVALLVCVYVLLKGNVWIDLSLSLALLAHLPHLLTVSATVRR
jgi:hypothetical protein